MNDFNIFLIAGMGLLAALVLWARRSAATAPAPASEAASIAQEVLAAVQLELPSRTLGERIFSLEDRDFVARQLPGDLQRQFLR